MADKKPTSKKSAAEAAEQKAKGEAVKEQALEGPLGQAIAAVRTPVYAYVGVNDLAIQAVSGMVADLRRRAEEAVTEAQSKVTERVVEAQNRINERVAGAQTRVTEVQHRVNEVPERVQALPAEVEELVTRFRPEELRKVADAYVQVAAGIYGGLAARGEDVVSRLREENPQLEAGLARVNEQVARAAGAVEEQVELGEDALGTVARQTRTIGVKAAGRVSKSARQAAETAGDAADSAAERVDEVAERVDKTAGKAADNVDKAADKAADRVDEAASKASAEVARGTAEVEARTAKKAPAKKAAAKKAPAKKAPAKKAAAKSTTTKATATPSSTGAATADKPAATKPAAGKPAASKPAATKSTAAKPAAASAGGDSDAPTPMELADNDPALTTADTPLPPAGTDRV
ncbi:hypothetical protein R3P82_06360 [Dietzia maris]|uniref:Heparin-binding hemagglutinin n=1 Tax=Dietzia maris TaxID=37915 RepID=A0AAE4QYC1_9ACTN|nr:hypothetical protein [Dietzia maris]MDV6298733.1 hypothetical protein [Dietzia maris]